MSLPRCNANPEELTIVRLRAGVDEAFEILTEYYEAVHVLQRDTAEDVEKIIEASDSGIWLAYLGNQAVGCVVLRKLPVIPLAAECKRLFVRPSARGNGIADKLLDTQEEYARSRGLEWLYLDTYDELKTAIKIYQRRGYERCGCYNNNPQATIFMRKYLGASRFPS